MRSEMMCDRGHKTGGVIAGGWNHRTVKRCQRRCHQRIPGVLIAGLSALFQKNDVAHRLGSHQAQSAREGVVWGHGDGFAGHVLGQARGFGVAVVDEGLCHLTVHLLLRPLGGSDKSVHAREVEQETDQPDATSADLDTDQVEGSNEPREEGKSRATLKELGHMRTDIEGIMPGVPRLQGPSGPLKPRGGLTLGDALRLPLQLWLEQIGPLEAVPEVIAVAMVAV
jgi:hypothetical protein